MDVNTDAVGIRAWCIEGFDAASFAEGMFGNTSIKLVGGDIVFARKQSKMAQRNNEMQKT